MRDFISQRPGLRRFLSWALPCLLIPGIIIGGAMLAGDKYYTWVIFAVALMSQLLFFMGYEKRTVGSRRMVIAAAMTALSVLGRVIFAAFPGFKPISAIVIITAIWIGKETGFLVGTLSALISNFFFGQGPWTPFQMLAWGLTGLVAGALSNTLKKSRAALAVYGALAGAGFSLTMELWSVIWYAGEFSLPLYLAGAVTALPHTLSYAISNVIFLLILGRPFGEKLERVKIKYGV